MEKENVNDKETNTQKDNAKEVKEKEKPATLSMSQYRASLRYKQSFFLGLFSCFGFFPII